MGNAPASSTSNCDPPLVTVNTPMSSRSLETPTGDFVSVNGRVSTKMTRKVSGLTEAQEKRKMYGIPEAMDTPERRPLVHRGDLCSFQCVFSMQGAVFQSPTGTSPNKADANRHVTMWL